MDFESAEPTAEVVDLMEYRETVKTLTNAEMVHLEGLPAVFQERQASYTMDFINAVDGAPICCFIRRNDRDATHSIAKDGRLYLLLGEDGSLWKRSPRLTEIASAASLP